MKTAFFSTNPTKSSFQHEISDDERVEMIKIGLTGGVCSGKSFVLSLFARLGAYTTKADELSKKLLFDANKAIRKKISSALGIPEFGPDQKDMLRNLIYSDEKYRLMVNQIIHPLVKKERKKLITKLEKSKQHSLFVYESALILEAGIADEFDCIVLVYCNQEEQYTRLMKRDSIDRKEAEKRIKSQLPLEEKLKSAHYVINTSGAMEQTLRATLEVVSFIFRDFKLKSDLIE